MTEAEPKQYTYRCKACDTEIPHGRRMQYCECGKCWVDWGASGRSSTIRVGWPDGNPDDWLDIKAAPEL